MDPAILHEYDSTIKSQLEHGIVEPSEDLGQVHYHPHHAVVRRDKETTKVRVVYDASAHSDGPSLNDCLHAGPKLNQKILDILLRFRVHRVAVIADIEKAFLMVSMAGKDRDVLRFLWFKDALTEQHELLELRFTRVVFGITSSPFLLNATLRHHLEKYKRSHPHLIEKLLYVDDLACGASGEEQAYLVFATAREILKDARFNLRKFYSNSDTLQARINPLPQGTPPTEDPDESYTSSTLGGGQKPHSGAGDSVEPVHRSTTHWVRGDSCSSEGPHPHKAKHCQSSRPILRPYWIPSSGIHSLQNLPARALPSED